MSPNDSWDNIYFGLRIFKRHNPNVEINDSIVCGEAGEVQGAYQRMEGFDLDDFWEWLQNKID